MWPDMVLYLSMVRGKFTGQDLGSVNSVLLSGCALIALTDAAVTTGVGSLFQLLRAIIEKSNDLDPDVRP